MDGTAYRITKGFVLLVFIQFVWPCTSNNCRADDRIERILKPATFTGYIHYNLKNNTADLYQLHGVVRLEVLGTIKQVISNSQYSFGPDVELNFKRFVWRFALTISQLRETDINSAGYNLTRAIQVDLKKNYDRDVQIYLANLLEEASDADRNVTCNFQNGFLCGYQHVALPSFGYWIKTRMEEQRVSTNSGPNYDHTFGNASGYYLLGGYLTAAIQTPLFTVEEQSCLKFYLIFRGSIEEGKHLGSFRVYLNGSHASNSRITNNLVYEVKQNNWNWRPIKIDIPRGRYVVEFKVEPTKENSENFVGIDDVSLSKEKCNEEVCSSTTFQCKFGSQRSCESIDKQCNVAVNCDEEYDEANCKDSNYFCDMERIGACNIIQPVSPRDQFDWHILPVSAVIVSASGGPSYDHTSKTVEGHVAYFSTLTTRIGSTAKLEISILLSSSSGTKGCLTFRLSMVSMGQLMVFLTLRPNKEKFKVKFRGVDHKEWMEIQIPINYETVMVTFHADILENPTEGPGYMAIDDISINRGACKNKEIQPYRCHKDLVEGVGVFFCRDGSGCVDDYLRCNLDRNCPDGSDEIGCTYFLCFGSFDRHPMNLRCNGYPDCLLGEDEMDCICRQDQFQCESGGCVDRTNICDGGHDCADGSDERNCQCSHGFYCNVTRSCVISKCFCPDPIILKTCDCDGFRCKNFQCIRQKRVCDDYEDCDDGSDEAECAKPCDKTNQVKCPTGRRCIQKDWMCDGYADCEYGLDEVDCVTCSSSEFVCDYKRTCIPMRKRCDGVIDCQDGSDEDRCVIQISGGILYGHKSDAYHPFCADKWNNSWNEKICGRINGAAPLGNIVPRHPPTDANSFLVPDNSLSREFNMTRFLQTSRCPSTMVASLMCASTNCAFPGMLWTSAYIIGGDVAHPRQWPYVVSVLRHSSYVCTGVLIHNSWVLTAAHCFIFKNTTDDKMPSYFMPWIYSVRVGSNMRMGPDSNLQVAAVKRIHLTREFGMHETALYPDIALIELDKPITITNFARPACLPTPFLRPRQCYVLGWGIVNIIDFDTATNYLRQAKMQIDSKVQCMTSAESSYLQPGQMCLGYASESVRPCHGDSGGPLMCRSPSGRWSVTGIVSSGPDQFGTCASQPPQGTIFTNVSYFLEWITLTMSSSH